MWQNGVMKQGLHDLAEKFSVRAGQRGFFARPSRKLETLTLAERAQQGHLPFELGKNKEGKRQKKSTNCQTAFWIRMFTRSRRSCVGNRWFSLSCYFRCFGLLDWIFAYLAYDFN